MSTWRLGEGECWVEPPVLALCVCVLMPPLIQTFTWIQRARSPNDICNSLEGMGSVCESEGLHKTDFN